MHGWWFEPWHDKTNKMTVRPAKTQISLGVHPVWSESLLSAWRNIRTLATNWADSEDSDQTGWNPGRFAHFPVRPWVFSPTFPFAPSCFSPGSFRPLSRSPLSHFAHFPFAPASFRPPYKILFLVLLFRSQKWYKALIFLLIDEFWLTYYKRWKKKQTKKTTAFYAVFRKVIQQCSYVNRNPDLFSAFCVRISHELLWHL